MKKTFKFKNLIAFVLVFAFMLSTGTTLISTQAALSNRLGSVPVRYNLFNGFTNRNSLIGVNDDTLLSNTKVMVGTTQVQHNSNAVTIQNVYDNGLSITPPSGYYVVQVIFCCNDSGNEGLTCQTAQSSRLISFGNTSYASAAFTITAQSIQDAHNNATGNMEVFHTGGGTPLYIMVQLATCPSPAYLKYDAGNAGLFDYSGTATVGSVSDNSSKLNQDAYSYTYKQGVDSVPQASILAINPELVIAAAKENYYFAGWELQYYTTANATTTDVTLSGANGASSMITATVKPDGTVDAITSTVSMHLHAQLTAKWEKGNIYTVQYHLQNSDKSGYTVDSLMSYPARVRTVIYSADHLSAYKAPEGYSLNTTLTETSVTVNSNNSAVLDIYYDRNDYTVSYYVTNPSENSPTLISQGTYTYGAALPSETLDDVTGYTADFWYDTNSSSGTKATVPKTMPAKDLEYYGFYNINSHTVTYYFNTVQIGQETYRYGDSVTVWDFPTNVPAGKYITAKAWGSGDGTSIVFTPGSAFTMPDKDLSLYVASDGDVIYTVKLVLIDEKGSAHELHVETFKYGETFYQPQLPTYQNHPTVFPEGYSAHGWYTDSTLTTNATFPHTVTSDYTFYAGVTANDYKVYYYYDGAKYMAETYTFGEEVTVLPLPTLTGHSTFAWYNSSVDPGFGNYGPADVVPGSKFNMPAKDVYLYGWSDINLYNIIYYLDGQELTKDQIGNVQTTYAYNDDVAPAPLPTKTGYTVTGWKDSNGNDVSVVSKMPANDLKYYAFSSKNSYTVQYFINEKAVSDKIVAKYGETVTADAFSEYQSSIPEGHKVLSDYWTFKLLQSDPTYTVSHQIKAGTGTFTMPASDVELHINTGKDKFVLKYWIVSEDGKTTTLYGQANVEFGKEETLIPIPANTDQYTYSGWYTTQECTTLHATRFNMPAREVNVYAKPITNKYTVEYYIDGVYYVPYGVEAVPYGSTYNVKAFPNITGKQIASTDWTVIVKGRANVSPGTVAPESIFTMPAANLILEVVTDYIDYNINYYVEYDVKNYHYQGPTQSEMDKNVSLIPKPSDSNGLYSYTDWAPDGTDIAIASDCTFKMPARDVNFYSKATQVNAKYVVRYLEEGTNIELKAPETKIGQIASTVTETQPEIKDYVFADTNNKKSIQIDKDSDKNEIIFYYKVKEYKVTFYVTEPGETSPKVLSETYYAPGEAVSSAILKDIECYTAYSWYESDTKNTEEAKADIPEIMPKKDLEYYGFYNINSYTVKYYFNAAEIGVTETYQYGKEVKVRDFPTPEAGKYITATAWGSEDGTSIVFTPGSTFTMPAKNLSLFVRSDGVTQHTVTWILIDETGDEHVLHTDTYKYDSPITARHLPTSKYHSEVPEGYSVHGWYTDATLKNKATIPHHITSDLTYYAGVNLNEYNVIYHLDGNVIGTETYDFGEAVVLADTPSLVGHNVYAWYKSSDDPHTYEDNNDYEPKAAYGKMPAHDVYLYAWSDINLYNVRYYLDGVRLTSDQINGVKVSYEHGEAVIPANLPVKAGYDITGWFDKDGKEAVFPTSIESDLDYYAYSSEKVYTVQYFVNDEPVSEPIEYKYSELVDVHAFEDYEHKIDDGHEFVGEYWTFNLLDENAASVPVSHIEEDSGYFEMPASDVKLCAVTAAVSFNLNYWIVSEDGKTVSQYGKSASYECGHDVVLVDIPKTTEQYTYSGWYTSKDCKDLHANVFKMPANDVNVYSKPETNKYTVEYHIDGVRYEAYGVTEVPYGSDYTVKAFPEIPGKKIVNDSWTVIAVRRSIDVPTSVDPNSTFKMPAMNLILEAATENLVYNVNYYVEKDGEVTLYKGPFTHHGGDYVDLESVPNNADGLYEYSAWTSDVENLVCSADGNSFVMPYRDVNFYTKAAKVKTGYTVICVDIDSGERLYTDNNVGNIGEVITKVQFDIHGYEFAEGQMTETITLSENEAENVIIFYYKQINLETTYRVDYKVYDPRYDTGDPESDHIRYRTLDYYEGTAEIGDVVTARNRTFAGYTEIPGQKKSIVISEYSNRIIVLYTDDSYDDTPDYFIQYFFNGELDDSMTVYGEGKVGDVIKAADFYLDDPTYTLVEVRPSEEITLQLGVVGIINLYYEYEVEEPVVPVTPVIPVDPDDPVDPDEPVVDPDDNDGNDDNDDPDNKDSQDDNNDKDNKENEDPFVPQQPDNPLPPNTSDVSYVYGLMAVIAALAAAGILASKKLLR